MTDVDDFADEVLTNLLVPRGWQVINRDRTVVVAVEDALAGCRNWFELEQEWLASQ